MGFEKAISFHELSEEKKVEFEKLADDYVTILHYINIFIEQNKLDYDEVWDKANQAYDEDLSHAPNED